MALKSVIQKVDYDTLSEPLRALYTEKDGKYLLDAESLTEANELRSQLAAFRDNNRSLNNLKTDLEAKLKIFDGVDPAKYAEMTQRITELEAKGVKGSTDVEAQLRAAVAAAVGPLEAKIAAREASEKAAVERADREGLRSSLTAVGNKVGIDERAMQDYINRGLTVFTVVNGEIVARKGDAPVFSHKNPAEVLQPEEWALDLQTEAPHLFRPSKGGGAGGSGSGPVPGSHARKIISSDPLEFGRNLEGLAKGEVTVIQ